MSNTIVDEPVNMFSNHKIYESNKLFVNGGGSHFLDLKSPIKRKKNSIIPISLFRNPREIS